MTELVMNREQKYPVDSSQWIDPSNYRWRTSLFRPREDLNPKANCLGAYTFEEGKKIFLECATEYEAAMKMVSSWEHWKAVADSPINRKHIESWREEKLLKDQTEARKLLLKAAEDGNLSAAKLIYEAKKEERNQKLREQELKAKDHREDELLNQSAAKIISIKAQS